MADQLPDLVETYAKLDGKQMGLPLRFAMNHSDDEKDLRRARADLDEYCYIDNCYQGSNHFIEGQLHSVQPIACEKYPVFVLSRRSWCLITTENFGPVIQTEIGALIVGGIINPNENVRCTRGSEKGHFELAGSTIVLLFQPERISLRPELEKRLAVNKEIRVQQGMWIADRINNN